MEKVLFKEEQRFTQWWMWVIMVSSFLFPMILIGNELANTPEDRNLVFVLFIISAIGFFVLWFAGKMKLVVEITTSQIHFKFLPFLYKWRVYKKEEIEKYEVRTYKPIREFGGWGIKGMNPKNKAYNVRGNVGLQLYLKNGNRLLLGTQRKQAIKYAMNQFMQT